MTTTKELKERLGDGLCEHCPYTRGETSRSRIGTCEGDWCDEALQEYCDENGLEIDGDTVKSETDLLKESIRHCMEVEKSCHANKCGQDHHRLRGWLTELLNIKLRQIYDEEEIEVQSWRGDKITLTRDDIWGMWPPTEKRDYALVRIPDYNEDCTNIRIRMSAEEFDKVKKFKLQNFVPYEVVDD